MIINDERELERQFSDACAELEISKTDQTIIESFLAPLKNKDAVTRVHYLHSLRVGLLARRIGRFLFHEEKPLLYAGILHDLGKCQLSNELLGKSESWTDQDQKKVQRHVMDGYRLLRGRLDVTAEIMLWHHRFQKDGYPRRPPPFLHHYRETTKLLIREYGRIIALADVYDALHRADGKFGEKKLLTDAEIRAKMFVLNPDRKRLVTALYEAEIFL